MHGITDIKEALNEKIIRKEFLDLLEVKDWFSALKINNIEEKFDFKDDNYCRVSLLSCEAYDLLVCCWKPGQESALHGHPKQGCLVKILHGTLTEEVHYADGQVEERLNQEGATAYINDAIGEHRVWNGSEGNAVSLHLYAPGGYKPQFKD